VPSRDADDRAAKAAESDDEVEVTESDDEVEDADVEAGDVEASDVEDGDADAEDADRPRTLSDAAAARWAEIEVDPIELALPSGVGLTLRHYDTDTDEDGDEVEEAVMLTSGGKLHLFRSAEGLVDFVKSDAEHDLTYLDGWSKLTEALRPEDVVPDDDDEYSLDLVVENLRGGHDVWEPELLIAAGEVSRDIAYACELNDVLTVLAPGSPLDNLDEGLRSGGFLARRRLKKIGSEQAALGWRSVIGKISAAVEWHD
jgi:hypothetical protein